jgi:hypothetical protein
LSSTESKVQHESVHSWTKGAAAVVVIVALILVATAFFMAFTAKKANAQSIGSGSYRTVPVPVTLGPVATTTTITQNGRKLSFSFAFNGTVNPPAILGLAVRIERRRRSNEHWRLYKPGGGTVSFVGTSANGLVTPTPITLPKHYQYRFVGLVVLKQSGKKTLSKRFPVPLLRT